MKCDCGTPVDPAHLLVGQTYISLYDKQDGLVEEVFCSMKCFNNSRGSHIRD